MAMFEVVWRAEGSAIIEADTEEEAFDVMHDSLEHFSTIDLESFEVDSTDVTRH